MKKILLAIFTLLLFSNICSAELIGYWRLNSNVDDYYSSFQTESVGEENYTTNLFGYSTYETTATENYVKIIDNDYFDVNQISIAFWFKGNNDTDIMPVINKREDSSIDDVFDIFYNVPTEKIRFRLSSDGTTMQTVSTLSDIKANKWYHIVCTFDNSNIKIYVDGELDNTTSYSGTLWTNDIDILIGHAMDSDLYLDGSISELRIYSDALQANSVNKIYNQSYPKQTFSFSNNLDLVLWLPYGDQDYAINQNEINTNIGVVVGDYMVFDGASQFELGNPSSLQLGDTNQTFICWLKTTATGYQYIYSKRDASVGAISFAISGVNQALSLVKGTTYNTGNTAINDGNWHHVAFVYNAVNRTCRVFIDGNVDKVIYNVSGTFADSADVVIGNRDGATAYLDGTLRDLQLYNSAKSSNYIMSDYMRTRVFY